ncbi:hypothetical protein [Photobacterium leiognathi]|uniref:hypothetical protein n=1 Tax=Photobacterium leiognathi TaxID=553611 RepID=UPI002982581E|nr:hypothetical protein [Photobacterium leiognathi]
MIISESFIKKLSTVPLNQNLVGEVVATNNLIIYFPSSLVVGKKIKAVNKISHLPIKHITLDLLLEEIYNSLV